MSPSENKLTKTLTLFDNKKTIYAINSEGDVEFGYMQSNYQEFSPCVTNTRMFESNNLEENTFDDLGEDVIAKFKWINMHSQEMEEVLKREEEL